MGRKRRTPKGGRRLAHHTPLLKIPVWWRRAVLPSLPWVVCFLSFFLRDPSWSWSRVVTRWGVASRLSFMRGRGYMYLNPGLESCARQTVLETIDSVGTQRSGGELSG